MTDPASASRSTATRALHRGAKKVQGAGARRRYREWPVRSTVEHPGRRPDVAPPWSAPGGGTAAGCRSTVERTRRRDGVQAMGAVSIVLLNQKGGVGKTSTCHHLAGTLAKMGRRVLLMDNDPQSSLTQGLLGPDAA